MQRTALVAIGLVGCGQVGLSRDAAVIADSPPADGSMRGPFGSLMAITELNTAAANEEDPSVTGDLLEIFFVSSRPGGLGSDDIWTATRTSMTSPWGAPVDVTALSSAGSDLHPRVSPDGLVMYLASDRTGGMGGTDIYVSARATRMSPWSPPSLVTELSSPAADDGAAPDPTGLMVVLCSNRNGASLKDLYLSTRLTKQAAWSIPVAIAAVNTNSNDQDGVLADGGRALYFARGVTADNELMVARRASTSEPFGAPSPVTEVNTPNSELDPWISEDEQTLFLNSDRGGSEDLYVTTRRP